MKKVGRKRHIISLRVSTEEWDTLQEIMKGLQLKRVSDLMREGFRMLAPTDSFQGAIPEGSQKDR